MLCSAAVLLVSVIPVASLLHVISVLLNTLPYHHVMLTRLILLFPNYLSLNKNYSFIPFSVNLLQLRNMTVKTSVSVPAV